MSSLPSLNASVNLLFRAVICKWKEKVQKNTGRRRKVQVTKAAFKGLHRFVFFTADRVCPVLKHNRVSEVFKRSKVLR